jgi:HEAT repeat protein
VAQKLRLIQGLDQALSDTEIAALAQTEPSEIVRVALLRRSGSSGLAEKLLADASAEVRQAAVQTLAFRRDKSQELIAALQKRAEVETNEIVRLAVFRALTFQRKDDALAELASKTDSDGDAFRIFALECDKQNPDVLREKCLGILKNPPSEPVRVAAIGHLGELKDRPGEKRVYAALVTVAREPSFGARSAAISALGSYGDRAAIAVLEPLTRHPLSFFRNSAAGAIARIPNK